MPAFIMLALQIIPQLIQLAPSVVEAVSSVNDFIARIKKTHAQPGGPTEADIQALRDLHAANDARIANPNTTEV